MIRCALPPSYIGICNYYNQLCKCNIEKYTYDTQSNKTRHCVLESMQVYIFLLSSLVCTQPLWWEATSEVHICITRISVNCEVIDIVMFFCFLGFFFWFFFYHSSCDALKWLFTPKPVSNQVFLISAKSVEKTLLRDAVSIVTWNKIIWLRYCEVHSFV